MQRNQKGFTLIELVIVIVILGILSAFALPRFADLGSDARQASLEGAAGAVRSSASIARSAWLAAGDEPGTIDLEGISIAMSGDGYPAALEEADDDENLGITEAAQLDENDYSFAATGDTLTISLADDAGGENCQFTYDETDGRITDLDAIDCD